MSDIVDNFSYGWRQNFAAKIRAMQEQERSHYRREEINLGAMYDLEREQFKANTNRELVHLKHSHAVDIEERRSNLAIELEGKRSILARWIEEFRGKKEKEVEQVKQDGRLMLQEREHVHRRLLIELEQAEERYRVDDEFERHLEITKQNDKLQIFQKQRESLYALELKRFESVLTDRENFTSQLLQEFSARNELGKSHNSVIGSMFQNNLQTNNKMNEMILAAVISKLSHSHEKGVENASKDAVSRALNKWESEG